MIVKELNSSWEFSEKDSINWMPAEVPGCVHTDLIENKKIKDPFYRLNEHDLQWIDKKDWLYKTEFDLDQKVLSKDRIVIDFKGLDTYVDVYLNDQKVLSADNMFREWTVDVKKYLKTGKNKLKIEFKSPIREGLKFYDANGFVYPGAENDQAKLGQVEGNKRVSIYTRKAGYHYGWDWGPRLVSSGIWRPVYLKAWDNARIHDLQIVQNKVNDDIAKFTAVLELESEDEVLADIQIQNEGEELVATEVHLRKGIHKYELNFDIENPKLWWPNGLGDQNLYHIKALVNVNGKIEEASRRIGIRTVEVVREKDEKGTSFYFKVNGVPVFMKGANYIPNDIFPSRVSKEQLEKVIHTAKTSNMNMLRVWGGGYYEDDLFYDLCDEAGILVWQDFMFACAMYPGNQDFLDNIRLEARDNIKRLRNHPSIALWCGNNEILVAWNNWGWKRQAKEQGEEVSSKVWKAYADIFHEVLPKAVEEYDSSRFYWSSSPSSGTGVKPDLINGDDHYWGVWWGKEPFETYATHIARFMSEYGFQSFPQMKSVRKYAEPEDYDIYSEVMKSHQRSSIGNETIEYYMLKDYKKPKDFESFLYVNHVLQAEGIKFALEGHRRAMPYCMGSLYWQINDCWPVASWSSTDYYQEWKALQYYVKKGFEPLLVSPYAENDSIKLAVVNDHQKEIEAKLIMRVLDFSGKENWSEIKDIVIRKNSSEVFFAQELKSFLQNRNPEKEMFLVELQMGEEVVARNTLYFKSVKDLKLLKPNVEYTIVKEERNYEINISSDVLAKNVFLTLGDEDGFFSDNYFDVLAGESVNIKLETELSLEEIKKVIQLRTLDSTFE
ncbi:glycosyl hydrolase 2 galactose-binding domain-containing protein [Marinifilum fragile]|uniref:beta-mannosidase n=1 Tax=Marinifilum fragile TaxID=570161 RepID=UPI002AABAB69|nr:glycoside hydrolase family 2 protein [Marinifilum fragile]